MLKQLKPILEHNPALRFLCIFFGSFALLYYFNILYFGLTSTGAHYNTFLDQNLNYISGLRDLLIGTSAGLLRQAGYTVYTSEFTLHVKEYGGFNVVYSCLGFGVMSFFTAFAIAYPKPLRSKLIFIPAGLVFIQLMNLVRFILIALFYWKNKDSLAGLDHHTLFNTVLYLLLGLLIYAWINRADKPEAKQQSAAAQLS